MDRFGSFLGRFGVVVGSLWIVLDRFGSFWVVPRFSNYAKLNVPFVKTSIMFHAMLSERSPNEEIFWREINDA